jgi:subtilisin family serine protease
MHSRLDRERSRLDRDRRRQERTAELRATAEAQQAAIAAADATAVTAAINGSACALPAPSALTVLQAKQLYAQVQMQAQLLLQTVALAGMREPSELVCKRWGWKSAEVSGGGMFRAELVCQSMPALGTFSN